MGRSGARTSAPPATALAFLVAVGCSPPAVRGSHTFSSTLQRVDESAIRVPYGTTIDASLDVRNLGEHPLRFRARSSTCGCLSIVSNERQLLAPGQIASIHLVVEGDIQGVRTEKLQLVIEPESGEPFLETIPIQVWTGGELFLNDRQLSFSGRSGSTLSGAITVRLVLEPEREPPELEWKAGGGLGFELEGVTSTKDGALSIAEYVLTAKLPADVGTRSQAVAFSCGDHAPLTVHASVITW